MEKIFKLKEKGTSIKTEILAGITTFLTMAYILGVNPGMLSAAGMDFQSVFLATAIASGVACIIMGLVANYPIGLAPGMGINAFFTFSVCLGMQFTYQEALAAVFVSGILFLIVSVTGIRKKVIECIPKNLKLAIGAGIGFFIGFLGLSYVGVIILDPVTKVALGNILHPTVMLGIFGIVLTVILMAKKIDAAPFYGLVATAILGVILGLAGVEAMPTIPGGVVSFNFEMNTLGAFLEGFKTLFTRPEAIGVIFTFLFIDFFDTAGTLVAVGNAIGLVDEEGKMENIEKALLADSIGTCVGACLGTSTITSYVESGSGVNAGGRTGLTAVVTGILFLLSTIFLPLLSVVQGIGLADGTFLYPVTGPALVTVGILMATQLKAIDWDDFAVCATAFTIIIMMVLTYSIYNGIVFGFLIYGISMIATKRAKEVHPIMWGLIIAFLGFLIFL